jgi:hypothetical protein
MQQLNGQKTTKNPKNQRPSKANSKDYNNRPHAIFSKVNGPAIMKET